MGEFNPPTLWDAHQIADYLRISRKTVQNTIVHQPGFPKPISATKRNKLWLAEDVTRYLTRRAA